MQPDAEAVLQGGLDRLAELVPCRLAVAWLPGEPQELVASRGVGAGPWRAAIDNQLLEDVHNGGNPVLLPQVLCVPLVCLDRRGILYLTARDDQPFGRDDLEAARRIAAETGLAFDLPARGEGRRGAPPHRRPRPPSWLKAEPTARSPNAPPPIKPLPPPAKGPAAQPAGDLPAKKVKPRPPRSSPAATDAQEAVVAGDEQRKGKPRPSRPLLAQPESPGADQRPAGDEPKPSLPPSGAAKRKVKPLPPRPRSQAADRGRTEPLPPGPPPADRKSEDRSPTPFAAAPETKSRARKLSESTSEPSRSRKVKFPSWMSSPRPAKSTPDSGAAADFSSLLPVPEEKLPALAGASSRTDIAAADPPTLDDLRGEPENGVVDALGTGLSDEPPMDRPAGTEPAEGTTIACPDRESGVGAEPLAEARVDIEPAEPAPDDLGEDEDRPGPTDWARVDAEPVGADDEAGPHLPLALEPPEPDTEPESWVWTRPADPGPVPAEPEPWAFWGWGATSPLPAEPVPPPLQMPDLPESSTHQVEAGSVPARSSTEEVTARQAPEPPRPELAPPTTDDVLADAPAPLAVEPATPRREAMVDLARLAEDLARDLPVPAGPLPAGPLPEEEPPPAAPPPDELLHFREPGREPKAKRASALKTATRVASDPVFRHAWQDAGDEIVSSDDSRTSPLERLAWLAGLIAVVLVLLLPGFFSALLGPAEEAGDPTLMFRVRGELQAEGTPDLSVAQFHVHVPEVGQNFEFTGAQLGLQSPGPFMFEMLLERPADMLVMSIDLNGYHSLDAERMPLTGVETKLPPVVLRKR
ncbi:MAG: hypothetical protein HY319_03745 [Armatimonadetes bacterium]|nr:hypothetical protein [Armatimonadota bacterium]